MSSVDKHKFRKTRLSDHVIVNSKLNSSGTKGQNSHKIKLTISQRLCQTIVGIGVLFFNKLNENPEPEVS